MQSFSLPSALLQDLDKTNGIFFWNKDPNAGVVHMIGWDTLCLPKSLGGVGFRKAKITKMAFQMKIF